MPAIRDVLHRYSLGRPDRSPERVAVLRHRVDAAWRTWHTSPTRRTDVGLVLPALLTDCQDAAVLHEGGDRRAAHAVLADAYHLAQHVIVNAAEPELLWLVVERGMAAAQIADEPLALAGAAWIVGMMLRAAGRMDEAVALVREGTDLLEPRLSDAPDEWLGMYGALHLHAAQTAARAGREGDAWVYWDRAERAARRLPDGYAHSWTVFGRANTDLAAVSLTVDLWRSREALRRAESIEPSTIPSRERRAGCMSRCRGYHAADERIAATRLLLAACDEGIDAVRYSPAGRAMVDDLRERPPRAIREDVRTLATRLGLDQG